MIESLHFHRGYSLRLRKSKPLISYGIISREVARWWRERSEMTLIADSTGWRIEGPGSDRARLAYARLEGDQVVYEIA
jgi:hypothetical protein